MKSLQGQILIASPQLLDPNFFRSIVLMVQHDDAGALGVILNRPLEATIKSAWEQVSEVPCEIDQPLHQGGPCEGPLIVLHTDESASEIEVMPGVFFTTDKQSVERLVAENAGPMKFYVGYAGWGPGQLENELEEGGWLTSTADPETVFQQVEETESVWINLVKKLNADSTPLWMRAKVIPEDPSVN